MIARAICVKMAILIYLDGQHSYFFSLGDLGSIPFINFVVVVQVEFKISVFHDLSIKTQKFDKSKAMLLC